MIPQPLQAEIWRVKFFPTVGREQSGVQPALVVSGNVLNQHTDILFACPLTSSVKDLFGVVNITRSEENGLKNDSQILVFQMRALARERFLTKIGIVRYGTVNEVLEELSKLCRH